MARRPDDRPQLVSNFASKMMREAKKAGFSGLELRSISKIFEAMTEAVPENAPAKTLMDFDEPRERLPVVTKEGTL